MKAHWNDPFSPSGQREATAKILTGMNYRLFFEGVTRRRLIEIYKDLTKISKSYPKDDDTWRAELRKAMDGKNKNLRYWLIGLTKKTADNLGYRAEDLPDAFNEIMDEL